MKQTQNMNTNNLDNCRMRLEIKIIVLFLCLSFVVSFSSTAQNLQPTPMDTTIRYGKLSNGLTYYIRHNEQPKERAEFFIAQNVGAILEEDSQNGLAHFLEHMAFNGTKNFPGKNLINYFETVGVRFGDNINAYTSLDETVYNLSEVPTTRCGIIDSALLALHDWSSFILLEGNEIDKERGVIREEWRQGQDADRRLWAASNKVTMAGSQYAKRDIIGDTAVINHFSYQTLRDYYKKWYRPDLQAILIVGDIDVSQVEAKIKALFSDIPAPVNPATRIYYPVPDNNEPIVGVFTDPEMQTTQVSLYFKQDPLPDHVKLSVQGYTLSIVKSLISSMTDKRLEEIRQEPETPFTSTESAITDWVRTKDIFAFVCCPATGKEKAARERLLKEAETVKRFGFTPSELERAKTNMLSRYEKIYNERNQQKNNNLAREYARNFLTAEPIPGIEWEFKFASDNLPGQSVCKRIYRRKKHSLHRDRPGKGRTRLSYE
jgi:zinc protease